MRLMVQRQRAEKSPVYSERRNVEISSRWMRRQPNHIGTDLAMRSTCVWSVHTTRLQRRANLAINYRGLELVGFKLFGCYTGFRPTPVIRWYLRPRVEIGRQNISRLARAAEPLPLLQCAGENCRRAAAFAAMIGANGCLPNLQSPLLGTFWMKMNDTSTSALSPHQALARGWKNGSQELSNAV
jgi:hypothetical protein